MIFYKGYLMLTVALFMVLMSAWMVGWIHLPLPSAVSRVPSAGPFVVGMAFALISSPCTSPVLFAVLAMSSTSGHLVWSVLTMAAYGFGYTLIIFLASVFTGVSKNLSGLKYHGEIITRISAGLLLLTALWAFYQGASWFWV